MTPTFQTIGGEITYFGIARPDGIILPPVGVAPDGSPIYERPLPNGFFILVEAKPGISRRAVDTSTFNWNPNDPNTLPAFQIVSSRNLGNGSAAVCDAGPSPDFIGGVPAVDPPVFGGSQAVANAINDLSCRFSARASSLNACTRNEFRDDSFASPDSTIQFCTAVGVGAEWAFPVGDTRLTARVLDVIGQPGFPSSIIVRVTEDN